MKLDAVRKLALALPDTTEEPHHQFGSFRVRGKIFVTFPPGEDYVHNFVPEDIREQAIAMDPEFIEKLLWGAKAPGVRVHLARARASTVATLVRQAHASKASATAGRGSGTRRRSATDKH